METEINAANCILGIELGSTRIKAVLIDRDLSPVASGSYEWENQFVDGVWTYSLDSVHEGVRAAYADLVKNFGRPITTLGAIGVSGMMHGYMPFDRDGRLLAGFRTWRNRITGEAAGILSGLFGFNVPQRWSVSHLYQAILNKEEHVGRVAYITTLAGYIHLRLTGKRVAGIGEASGMFPVDSATGYYDETMLGRFKEHVGIDIAPLLPGILRAGENAGYLTPEGAAFLDPSGSLRPGIPIAPCEGDVGTGMAATNSVRPRTGNVSAGTSAFAMIVTEGPVGVHREIDMVTTPDGSPAALVHAGTCTGDINAWVNLFSEFCELMGIKADKNELFVRLFQASAKGDADCGGLLSFNYLSGECITDLDEGRPVFARAQNARFTLANFMRTHITSALATLKMGMELLTETEGVKIDRLCAHGGFFKTPDVGQRMLSAAVNAPVSVMETSGEGGPYGMALLASYMLYRGDGESLADYLDSKVFANAKITTVEAGPEDVAGFAAFLERYKKALPMERAATEVL